ncbi:MAG: hypothetical protein RSC64_06550 [Hydrogenoanaerobacterium sp.]
MTTQTSSTKSNAQKQLYLSALRRGAPLGIFYTLLLFALFPLLYLLTGFTKNVNYLLGWAAIYNVISAIAVPLICTIIPIVIGISSFSYLHKKSSGDVFAALPLKRGSIFNSNFFAGLTLLWVPLLISFAAILLIGAVHPPQVQTDLGSYISVFFPLRILFDLLGWLTVTGTVYSITAAVAVLCGTIFDASMFALTFCGIYPLIYLTIIGALDMLLVGLRYISLNFVNVLCLSPFSLMLYRVFSGSSSYDTSYGAGSEGTLRDLQMISVSVGIWAVLAVLIFFAARELYKRRKSELAGRTALRTPLTAIAKYVLTLIFGCVGGFIFAVSFENKLMFIVGAFIGGCISYGAMEAILARGFKTYPKAFLHMAVPVVLVMCFGAVLLTGGLGFSGYIPAPEQIVSAAVNYNGIYEAREWHGAYTYDAYNSYNEDWEATHTDEAEQNRQLVTLTSPEGVEAIRALHAAVISEQLINGHQDLKSSADFSPSIEYTLKSGKKVIRSYTQCSKETARLASALDDIEEFKRQTNPAFLLTADEISDVTLINLIGTRKSLLADKLSYSSREAYDGKVTELLEALQKDFLTQKNTDILNDKYKELGFILLVPNENCKHAFVAPRNTALLITEQHTNTLEFLRKNKLLQFIERDDGNIKNVAVTNSTALYNHSNAFAYQSSLDFYYLTEKDLYTPTERYGGWVAADEYAAELYKAARTAAPLEADCYYICFKEKNGTVGINGLFVERSKLEQQLVAKLDKIEAASLSDDDTKMADTAVEADKFVF